MLLPQCHRLRVTTTIKENGYQRKGRPTAWSKRFKKPLLRNSSACRLLNAPRRDNQHNRLWHALELSFLRVSCLNVSSDADAREVDEGEAIRQKVRVSTEPLSL
jgi:hypothetical protein